LMKRNAMSPPPWAERVLVALLPAERAESDSGDLLEAYRDEQLPARGVAGADRWYIRRWPWCSPTATGSGLAGSSRCSSSATCPTPTDLRRGAGRGCPRVSCPWRRCA
jgi:hypothetical protein